MPNDFEVVRGLSHPTDPNPATVDNRDALARKKEPRVRNRGLRSKNPTYQGAKLKSVTIRVDLTFANKLRKEARARKLNLTEVTRALGVNFEHCETACDLFFASAPGEKSHA